jgi:hypothetical protein
MRMEAPSSLVRFVLIAGSLMGWAIRVNVCRGVFPRAGHSAERRTKAVCHIGERGSDISPLARQFTTSGIDGLLDNSGFSPGVVTTNGAGLRAPSRPA